MPVLPLGHAAAVQLRIDVGTTLAQPPLAQSEAVLPGGLKAPVLYRGVALSIAPGSETVRWGCCWQQLTGLVGQAVASTKTACRQVFTLAGPACCCVASSC